MPSVTVDIDIDEVLDSIDDKTLLRELALRLDQRRRSRNLDIEARRSIDEFRKSGGFAAVFGADAPRELMPDCDQAYLDWKESRNA